MRRILCLCAASSLLALGLAACGSGSEDGPPPAAESAADGSMDQGDGDLIPLFVLLDDGSEDGIQCATIGHDHDEHWHDKLSWYRCDDGSELLTDDLIEETFDRGDDGSSWTVQRAVDKKAPKELPVMDAVFAGNN